MRYFIDANVFLELLLNGKYAEECASLLKKVEKEEIKVIITDFLIYAIILAIERFGNVKKIRKFIESIPFFKGLNIVRPSLSELLEAIEIMENYKLDFDDALIVACMKKRRINNLISFDKHFEKVEEIKLLKPNEI